MESLRLLSDADVQAIHDATLRVLNEVGVVMTHAEGRALLAGAGARLDGDRVTLPPELVEASLKRCPDRVTVRGRGGQVMNLGDGALYWHNLGGARDVYDGATGQRRPAMLADVCESTRLLDAMPNVTTITPLYTPQDVPGHLMSLAMYRHALPHTTKPLQGPGVASAEEVRFVLRLAEVIGPPAEVLTLSVSPVSPLGFHDHVAETTIEIARQGIGFAPLPCPTAGMTGPMTLAGSVMQQNAELLASIVLAQIVRPGLPVMYCGRLAMMEPRLGTSVWGGVELGIASAMTVQMGHFYHLPVNVYGFSTNDHTPGFQSGYERALNAMIPALAGADELSGFGEMEAGVLSSSVQIVLDDELAASVRRTLRGVTVDEETLAVPVIAEAMAGSRNFLTARHTLTHLRGGGELLATQLAERGGWDDWDRGGRRGMVEHAQAKVEKLLAEHHVPALTGDQERALDEIMAAADTALRP